MYNEKAVRGVEKLESPRNKRDVGILVYTSKKIST